MAAAQQHTEFETASDHSSRRPEAVTRAVVLLGGAAFAEASQSALTLAAGFAADTSRVGTAIAGAIVEATVCLGLLLVAVLLIRGREAGRLAAYALCGVTVWGLAGWLIAGSVALARGELGYWGELDYAQLVANFASAAAALYATAGLATDTAVQWFVRERQGPER